MGAQEGSLVAATAEIPVHGEAGELHPGGGHLLQKDGGGGRQPQTGGGGTLTIQ